MRKIFIFWAKFVLYVLLTQPLKTLEKAGEKTLYRFKRTAICKIELYSTPDPCPVELYGKISIFCLTGLSEQAKCFKAVIFLANKETEILATVNKSLWFSSSPLTPDDFVLCNFSLLLFFRVDQRAMQLCDSVCALHGLNKAGTQYMEDVFCLFEKKYGTKYGFLLELIQQCLGKDKIEQCILIRIMLIK